MRGDLADYARNFTWKVDTCRIHRMKTIAGKITITEAAKRLSVSRQRMHKIISENGLLTELVHPRLFLIHPEELKKIRTKSNRGRKTKKET